MRRFADLYTALDSTTRTTVKVEALVAYFRAAPPADAAWAVLFLCGGKPKRTVNARQLATWAAELSGVSGWLFDESYSAVGDMAETISLLLPDAGPGSDRPLTHWVEDRLLPLRDAEEPAKREALAAAWAELNSRQRFVWTKLLTGAFRVGVSRLLVVRALAEIANLPAAVVAHRLMGEAPPTPAWYGSLISPDAAAVAAGKPYPFFLASPVDGEPAAALGDVRDWQAEWKWDGIRAQLIRRGGSVYLWSRGEELITERFPEIVSAAAALPDGCVLDGEVLPYKDGAVMPFAALQRRIGRKTVGKKLLAEVPCVLLAYDLLELATLDCRDRPLEWRRCKLEHVVARLGRPALMVSPIVAGETWEQLAEQRTQSRDRKVEGLMLKRKGSLYAVGRQRGDWWKWKIAPLTMDAVLIYAQPGHGKRAGLFTDYTFGVWEAGRLVPVAKAYSGLTDAEIKVVDAFIRKNTLEKFGPVRTVKPELVFELAFEGIQASSRHKSGVAVRFPRMLRQRLDKPADQADTLDMLKKRIALSEPRSAMPPIAPGGPQR